MNYLEDIQEVINKMCDGATVAAVIGGVKTFFCIHDNHVYMKNDKVGIKFTVDDYIFLFGKSSYVVCNKDEEIIDTVKDQEYYSWRNK